MVMEGVNKSRTAEKGAPDTSGAGGLDLDERINSERSTTRLLGIMFILVVVASALSAVPLESFGISLGDSTEDISETMVKISDDPTAMQLSIVGFLLEGVAIVLLATLLYTILRKQNMIFARWAFGLWIVEAVFVAVKVISLFSLLYTSQEFVRAGAPDPSYFQTLGGLFIESYIFSYNAQMVFYCVGGLLFYYLFYMSRCVPTLLSLFGILAASLGFVGTMFELFGSNVPMYVFLPILPFELAIGVWLIVKGIKDGSETK